MLKYLPFCRWDCFSYIQNPIVLVVKSDLLGGFKALFKICLSKYVIIGVLWLKNKTWNHQPVSSLAHYLLRTSPINAWIPIPWQHASTPVLPGNTRRKWRPTTSAETAKGRLWMAFWRIHHDIFWGKSRFSTTGSGTELSDPSSPVGNGDRWEPPKLGSQLTKLRILLKFTPKSC